MPLTFPTQAEQALEEFRSAKVTTSMLAVAKRRGAQVEREVRAGSKVVIYTFDDDTSLETSGQGAAWKAEAHLP